MINFCSFLAAQTTTDAELQNKYWFYRHRLRTEFMKVGKTEGHSIPASTINLAHTCGGVPGKISWGDATIDLGEYIAILAMEYKMLKDANQDFTATANELYFALHAVERLDDFAEVFFKNTASGNGFFV